MVEIEVDDAVIEDGKVEVGDMEDREKSTSVTSVSITEAQVISMGHSRLRRLVVGNNHTQVHQR